MKKLSKKKKKAPVYQFGGQLDKSFFEGIANSWKGVMSNPFGSDSQGYLTGLLNRNSVAGKGRAFTYGDPSSPFFDPNFDQSVYEGNTQSGDTDRFHEWMQQTGNTQVSMGSPEYEQLESIYQDQVAEQFEATNQGQYKGTYNPTEQLIETGSGIMGLMNSQAAYDSKKTPDPFVTKTNTGFKRFNLGGGIPNRGFSGLAKIPNDPMGLYRNDGPVNVPTPTGQITMEGINQPVLAIPNADKPEVMLPGQDYNFKNSNNVLEVPLGEKGGRVMSYQYGGKTWTVDKTKFDKTLAGGYKPALTELGKLTGRKVPKVPVKVSSAKKDKVTIPPKSKVAGSSNRAKINRGGAIKLDKFKPKKLTGGLQDPDPYLSYTTAGAQFKGIHDEKTNSALNRAIVYKNAIENKKLPTEDRYLRHLTPDDMFKIQKELGIKSPKRKKKKKTEPAMYNFPTGFKF